MSTEQIMREHYRLVDACHDIANDGTEMRKFRTKEWNSGATCLTCGKDIDTGYKWCTIECKQSFYNEQYAGSALAESLEREYREKREVDKAEALKKYGEWKEENPGKGMHDYIMGVQANSD